MEDDMTLLWRLPEYWEVTYGSPDLPSFCRWIVPGTINWEFV
jgi:hypothetical protein